MAMMLPIMVGLQMAVSVAELEQGELAMQNLDGKVYADWSDRQGIKNAMLEREKKLFTPPASGCPDISGFLRDSSGSECAYSSGVRSDEYAVVRFFKASNGQWSQCLIPAIGSSERCRDEAG
jgi:hypothetical protein